jgi:hypothetical protein
MGFTMVKTPERELVIEMLVGHMNRHAHSGSSQTEPTGNGVYFRIHNIDWALSHDTPFSKAVTEKYKDVVWLGMRRHVSTGTSFQVGTQVAQVAKIFTSAGLVMAWRNGWNAASGNFVVWFKDVWHSRRSMGEVLELIEMLTGDEKQLPLYLNSKSERNKTLAVDLLRS